MKIREQHNEYVIEVITYALRDGGYTAHFSIEKHDGQGVWDTYFTTGKTYDTGTLAKEDALRIAKRKVDAGFEIKVAS